MVADVLRMLYTLMLDGYAVGTALFGKVVTFPDTDIPLILQGL
jgi:hypothetical protein